MIVLKSPEEIEKIRTSCQKAAEILEKIGELVKPGVRTIELDRIAEELTRKAGGIPAFKGYRGYPSSLCVSVNEVIVHGIPTDRELEEGDIVSIDFGIKYDGFFGDIAKTFPVGMISEKANHLIGVTQDCLYKAIERMQLGNRVSDISSVIQETAEGQGFSVVREFVGHGIGRELHEEPPVPNFGKPGVGPRLKPGLCLSLEPMVNIGTYEVEVLEDGWTAVTADRKLSAHFEHTVAVTEHGPDILTAR